jgi:hypothetical protein
MTAELARYLRDTTPDAAQLVAALTMPAYLSAWDPVTGANTVTITGTQSFVNLAILCDPAQLAANVRVILLRTAGAPLILGRVRVPPY